jgi:nitrogen PTS system EIIA component
VQLSVRDAAEVLKVSEKSIYRWIKEGALPAYNIHGQYRFNRTELLEWATAQKVNVSVEILMEPETSSAPLPMLSEALTAGGVFYRIGGEDKSSVIRNVVEVMRLADEVDREFLIQVLLARESLGSTGVGEGIAIPHVRNPIVMHIARPIITLCFLEHPIDFGALDGRPVNVLFTLVSPTVRSHLHLLARLAFALRDPSFKDVVLRQGSRDEILREARRVEGAP